MFGAPSHWRRKRPSGKTRDTVLSALQGDAEMSAMDLASATGLSFARVCAALDSLMIGGQVELEDRKYRRAGRLMEASPR
jgi:predicted ArsR family transcriptional regulator